MECRFLLDVVIGEGAIVFQLLARKNQTLLVRWDTLLVLDLLLDIFNAIRRVYFKSDSLSRKGFHEDLHLYGYPLEISL
jgi:hypothetical protein